MSNSIKNKKQFSRRSFIPILGSSLLLPFFGFGENTSEKIIDTNKEEDFQTLPSSRFFNMGKESAVLLVVKKKCVTVNEVMCSTNRHT